MIARVFVGDDVRDLEAGAEYALPEASARHVGQALRMRVGDALTLFTGAGGEYETAIERIDRRGVFVRVRRHVAVERENAHPVALAQAVIAADMMDFVVRKAVELGVAAIVPVQAARSQGMPAERAARRGTHWRKIAIAACEQCGRNRVPPVHDVVALAPWLASRAPGEGIVLDAGARQPLSRLAVPPVPAAVLSGPEGGFTDEELQAARDHGFVAVHLGPRILRAETASIAALAALNALAG